MTDDHDEPQPRRLPRPVTKAWLQRAALYYLERYAAPAGHLRQVLMRKVDKRLVLRGEAQDEAVAEPARALVEEVIAQAVEGGYVDDGAYARAKVASLRRRGGSQRAIRAKLMQKGVPADLVDAAIEADGEEAASTDADGPSEQDACFAREKEAALAYARRRRLGPFRLRDRAERRERDIAAMVRAGFSLSLARSIIDSA
jgi:regulatory protein